MQRCWRHSITARKEADISTEVTFEDGRKGQRSARLKIYDLTVATQAPADYGEGEHEVARRKTTFCSGSRVSRSPSAV